MGDGLALAVASLRDAEFTLDDHDASYADIAEEAMSTYQMDGETGESWMHPKATAMAYSMLLDPPFVIQLIDHLSSDVSTKELLDQKCEAMRREAVPDPGSSCSTNVGKNVVLRACKRLTHTGYPLDMVVHWARYERYHHEHLACPRVRRVLPENLCHAAGVAHHRRQGDPPPLRYVYHGLVKSI